LVTNPAKSGPTLACDRCPNRLLGGASAGCAGIDLGCACLMSFVSNRGQRPAPDQSAFAGAIDSSPRRATALRRVNGCDAFAGGL
jgi:hypothetical protein